MIIRGIEPPIPEGGHVVTSAATKMCMVNLATEYKPSSLV